MEYTVGYERSDSIDTLGVAVRALLSRIVFHAYDSEPVSTRCDGQGCIMRGDGQLFTRHLSP
jgi:hypothetical protein